MSWGLVIARGTAAHLALANTVRLLLLQLTTAEQRMLDGRSPSLSLRLALPRGQGTA